MRMKSMTALGLASLFMLLLGACAEGDGGGGGNEAQDQTEEPSGDSAAEANITSVDTLVMGLVASESEQESDGAEERLAEELSDELGGVPVEIEEFETHNSALRAVDAGDAHLLMTTALRIAEAEEGAGAAAILQSVRNGESVHVAQWFTNDPHTYCEERPVADEAGYLFCNGIYDEETGQRAEYGPVGAEALENIPDGSSVTYVDEGLAATYFFPQTQIDALGTEVDARFAGDQAQSVLDVYHGEVAVGTSGIDARRQVVEDTPDVGEEVVVFAWAGPIPNPGIIASDVLSEEEHQVITEALLAIAGDEDLGEGDPLYDVYGIHGLTEPNEESLEFAREVYENFGDRP
ncbi:phosphate/phosphite/phosphonate ABC transporter substrate-binding protein [Nesterenkonia sphaerica]|nr:PhnD/SsuA/transferrin family substrate-binding protein [Nesterenkonia sphaerica]